MFGGMHRLHELSDKEKLYDRLIRGLCKEECRVDNIELRENAGEVPMLSCDISMPYKYYVNTDDAADAIRYFYGRKGGLSWPRRSGINPYGYPKRKNPTIEKVHFSGPVTAVIWSDGTKTIVRCDNEEFDHEKGLAMAIAKKFLGTNDSGSNYYDVFKKWLPKDEPKIKVNSDGITLTFDNGEEVTKHLGKIFGRPLISFGKSEIEI